MMNNNYEMNEEMMEQVNGGIHCKDDYEESCYQHGIHPHCGGYIENEGNPFLSCRCTECGDSHYFYADFFKTAEGII